MGVELKLTDKELPVSPVFVDFLAHIVKKIPFSDAEWGDQLSESLSDTQTRVAESAKNNIREILADQDGVTHIARSYELLVALMTGDLSKLKDLQGKFHFINIIGTPRNGGSYLTKELYRMLGFDPSAVPNGLAHDGFPEAGPFRLEKNHNSWMLSLQTMAEYLVMVELFFARSKPVGGKIQVPKKLLKGPYAGSFFYRVMGESVENILTLRHPVTSCISTYEKSGGLPTDGGFAVRGNIEEWIRRDLVYTGTDADEIMRMDYFDAYLRYWEQYHYFIATTGLSANRNTEIVAYGADRMMDTVRRYGYRFGQRQPEPEVFEVNDKRDRHSDWVRQSEPVIQRVTEVWSRVGLKFPASEVMECW
ncbi:MAG: hypothetical protein WDZ86_01780 [Gammaproteobacteria bacterium]